MSTTTAPVTSASATGGAPISTDDLVSWVAGMAPVLEEHAGRHDQEGSWVQESFQHLQDEGYLAAAVPVELGGRGATIGGLTMAQREMARHCPSTALASSMHHHVTAFTAWRYRRGLPGAEATLRRVVDDGIVLVSSGGSDFTRPRGRAERVEGGYRVSGHKVFSSQSPVGTVLATMFTYDDPERGRRVLNTAVPFADDGVTVLDTWDAMGMRGTASNDVVVEDVFVPDEKILADRPYGVLDPPFQVILSIAMPIIAGVYLGVAEAAVDHAVATATHRADETTQRRVGLMVNRVRVARWSLEGALDAVGDDPQPSMETVAAVLAAKREVALSGIEAVDLAMDVVGGAAYFKGSPVERAYRDIRAAKFHPLDPEATLLHAGRLALGEPCEEW